MEQEKQATEPHEEASDGAEEQQAQAASDSSDDANASQSVQDLQEALEAAQNKANEHWDQLLRTRAEMENIRRRGQRELENAHKYALEKFAVELLPVRDSLELGFDVAAGENVDVKGLREGTELTLKMLSTAMDKFGVTLVDPTGEPFNPEFHEAMTMQPAADVAPNTVLTVVQKGYLLNDRVIRPAKVIVSQAVNTEAKDSSNDAEGA